MIRKAEASDLDQIARIFGNILLHEAQHTKYTAFQAGVYPTRATAEAALCEETLYVDETDGRICACIIMNRIQPAAYRTIQWKYRASPEEVMVIHLLCVEPDRSGAGIGRKMLTFAAQEANKRNCRVIRLDTGRQNLPARHLYEKTGFTIAGSAAMMIGGCIPHDDHLFYEMRLTEQAAMPECAGSEGSDA